MSSAVAVMGARARQALADAEAVIERGLHTFVEVGNALLRIRDERLYRETHDTFEDYCRERWGMERAHAYRQIQAAQVAAVVSPIGDIPNEAQARELVPILRDEGEDAVVEVVHDLRAKHGERLTAEKVREAVAERLAFEQRVGSLKSSTSVEWYTPARYVEAAREVLGGIDLDPASSPEANETIRARIFYDAAQDGLAQCWRGRIWMNPPYGAACGEFVAKLLDAYGAGEADSAIALLNAYSTDVAWFQSLWDYPLCFTDHRIAFVSPIHRTSGSTTGSVFVYLGPDRARFADVFARFGAVVARVKPEAA